MSVGNRDNGRLSRRSLLHVSKDPVQLEQARSKLKGQARVTPVPRSVHFRQGLEHSRVAQTVSTAPYDWKSEV